MVYKHRFRDTLLPLNKRYRDSLSNVYGIGFQRASFISDSLGVGLSYNVNNINRYYFELSSVMMKYSYIVDYRLKDLTKQRLDYFLDIRLIKGIRIFKGLPVHGQRTHSNCKMPKKNKPLISKKFEFLLKKPTVVNEKGKNKGKGKSKDKVKNKEDVKKKKNK